MGWGQEKGWGKENGWGQEQGWGLDNAWGQEKGKGKNQVAETHQGWDEAEQHMMVVMGAMQSMKGNGKQEFFEALGNMASAGASQGGAGVVTPAMKGKSKGHKSKGKDSKGRLTGDAPPPRPIAWKLRLSNSYEKTFRRCPTKETITYTTLEEGGVFTSSVSCQEWTNQLVYEAPGTFSSKKEAEEAVAMVAMEAEYPELFANVGNEGPSKRAQKRADAMAVAGNQKVANRQVVLSWQSKLVQAYTKEHHVVPTKDSLVYSTEQVGLNNDGYMCQLVGELLANTYQTEEPQPTEKAAQDFCARQALEQEFPAILAGGFGDASNAGGEPAAKRHRTEKIPQAEAWLHLDPKSRLNEGLMVLTGHSMPKGAVHYETMTQDGQIVGRVTINCLDDGPQVFTGEWQAGQDVNSKRTAERSAAEAAFSALEATIEAKRPEHEANKEEKRIKREFDQLQKRAAS